MILDVTVVKIARAGFRERFFAMPWGGSGGRQCVRIESSLDWAQVRSYFGLCEKAACL